MAGHASWKGHLKISLAAIPVQAFTAAAGADSSDVTFHQLHKTCHRRVQYKKFCPEHGELEPSEIVSGYEFAKGEYVVVERDELARIASDLEKSLTIECFVPPDAVTAEYAAGQSYYLIPDGKAGQQPYALICEALQQTGLQGIGEFVISRKQRLVRLRAHSKLLIVDTLYYAGEIRPAIQFTGDVPNLNVKSQEVSLARSLVEQMSRDDFDPSEFSDAYSDRVRELVESKSRGQKIKTVKPAEPHIVSFMDALKKSVQPAKPARRTGKSKSKSTATTAKSPKLTSTARRTRSGRKTSRSRSAG